MVLKNRTNLLFWKTYSKKEIDILSLDSDLRRLASTLLLVEVITVFLEILVLQNMIANLRLAFSSSIESLHRQIYSK